MFVWNFHGREASLDNLVPGTTGGRGKYVCLSGYLLMTTEGLLLKCIAVSTYDVSPVTVM